MMRRPNILFILSDDQGAWALGCAGNAELRTPHLDRLAASGMRFDNFFCASPVCSPARASILTGTIPSRHGVHDWISGGNARIKGERGAPIEYLAGQEGYTEILARHGYRCAFFGKWHLGHAARPQKGFSEWFTHARGGGPYYGAPLFRNGRLVHEPRYVTEVITDEALAFLERQKGSVHPFHLNVHYTAPHSPWNRANHPAALYDDYLANCDFHSVPWLPTHPWQIASLHWADDVRRREDLSGYYAAVTAMDAQIGRLLLALERLGMREDTLVVMTSDNGMNMGHHGIVGKGNGTFPMNMYDTSVKVPFLVSWPGRVPAGKVEKGLWSQLDLFPTLLEIAGVSAPVGDHRPGRSFAPLLTGQPVKRPREFIVVAAEYGPVRMWRTRDWKYVHRYPYGPHELYHLRDDPDERHNRAGEKGMIRRIREMKAHLDEWFDRYADPCKDGARLPVTGRGQAGLVGSAGRGRNPFGESWNPTFPERVRAAGPAWAPGFDGTASPDGDAPVQK